MAGQTEVRFNKKGLLVSQFKKNGCKIIRNLLIKTLIIKTYMEGIRNKSSIRHVAWLTFCDPNVIKYFFKEIEVLRVSKVL